MEPPGRRESIVIVKRPSIADYSYGGQKISVADRLEKNA